MRILTKVQVSVACDEDCPQRGTLLDGFISYKCSCGKMATICNTCLASGRRNIFECADKPQEQLAN